MRIDPEAIAFHTEQCRIATELYVDGMTASGERDVWLSAKKLARDAVEELLKQSDYLSKIEQALQENAGHLSVLRRVLAPPKSQDQFALMCDKYSKQAEKDLRKLPAYKAKHIAEVISERIDTSITPWLPENRAPLPSEIERFNDIVVSLMTAQSAMTDQRKLLSAAQEQAVIELLTTLGWDKQASRLATARDALPAKCYMHKAPFATRTRPQEVDIACGLGGSVVLAMECKVTNDKTNSIKRINDVLKKSEAWQKHWGSFVKTAALLQGVIAPKDVLRLLEADVQVFWSHQLDDFANWLDQRISAAVIP